MTAPKRVLDLFCGAGGAAMGLRKAWPEAEIIGVDIVKQDRYPFEFEWARWDVFGMGMKHFDFIWASPPCQAYSSLANLPKQSHRPRFKMIEEVRLALKMVGQPFVIENVPNAPLFDPVRLCGQYFGLGVRWHRLFECHGFRVKQPNCLPYHKPSPIAVYGDHPEKSLRRPGSGGYINRAHTLRMGQDAMGIPWMEWRELTQAVPPAYSEYIAKQYLVNANEK